MYLGVLSVCQRLKNRISIIFVPVYVVPKTIWDRFVICFRLPICLVVSNRVREYFHTLNGVHQIEKLPEERRTTSGQQKLWDSLGRYKDLQVHSGSFRCRSRFCRDCSDKLRIAICHHHDEFSSCQSFWKKTQLFASRKSAVGLLMWRGGDGASLYRFHNLVDNQQMPPPIDVRY